MAASIKNARAMIISMIRSCLWPLGYHCNRQALAPCTTIAKLLGFSQGLPRNSGAAMAAGRDPQHDDVPTKHSAAEAGCCAACTDPRDRRDTCRFPEDRGD